MDYNKFLAILQKIEFRLGSAVGDSAGANFTATIANVRVRVHNLYTDVKNAAGDDEKVIVAINNYSGNLTTSIGLVLLVKDTQIQEILRRLQATISTNIKVVNGNHTKLYETINSVMHTISGDLKGYTNENPLKVSLIHDIGFLLDPSNADKAIPQGDFNELCRQRVLGATRSVYKLLKQKPHDASQELEAMIQTIADSLQNFITAIQGNASPEDAMIAYSKDNSYTSDDLSAISDKNLQETLRMVHSIAKAGVASSQGRADPYPLMLVYMRGMGAVIQMYEGKQYQEYFRSIGSAMIVNAPRGEYAVLLQQPMHFGGLHGDTALQWQAIHRIEAILQKLQMR